MHLLGSLCPAVSLSGIVPSAICTNGVIKFRRKLLLSQCRNSTNSHFACGPGGTSIIIDFPSLGITYNGGWCSATKTIGETLN